MRKPSKGEFESLNEINEKIILKH